MSDTNYKINSLFKKSRNKVHTKDSPFFTEPVDTISQVVPDQIWSQFSDLPTPKASSTLIHEFINEPLIVVPGSTISFYDPNRDVVDLIDPIIIKDNTYTPKIYDSQGVEILSGQNDWQIDYNAGVVTFTEGTSGIDVSTGIQITTSKYVGLKGLTSGTGAETFSALLQNHGYVTNNLPKAVYRATDGKWKKAKATSLTSLGTHIIVGIIDSNNVLLAEVGRYSLPGHGLVGGTQYSVSQTVSGNLVKSSTITSGVRNTILLVEDTEFIHVLPYSPTTISINLKDSDLTIFNSIDNTKTVSFNASAISSATVRSFKFADSDMDMADINSNKTNINNHLDGVGTKHHASEVNYPDTGDHPNVSSGSVEAAIDNLADSIGDLNTAPTNFNQPSPKTTEEFFKEIDTGLGDRILLSEKGSPDGVAELDNDGKVPTAQLPAFVLGSLSFQGTWDANANAPDIGASSPSNGYYYLVTVGGTTNLSGITDWGINDWAIYNGSNWQKIDNSETPQEVEVVDSLAGTETNKAPSVNIVKSEIIGNPTTSGDTLEKLENLINALVTEYDLELGSQSGTNPVDSNMEWDSQAQGMVTFDYIVVTGQQNFGGLLSDTRIGRVDILIKGNDSNKVAIIDKGAEADSEFPCKCIWDVDVNANKCRLTYRLTTLGDTVAVRFFNIKHVVLTSTSNAGGK